MKISLTSNIVVVGASKLQSYKDPTVFYYNLSLASIGDDAEEVGQIATNKDVYDYVRSKDFKKFVPHNVRFEMDTDAKYNPFRVVGIE